MDRRTSSIEDIANRLRRTRRALRLSQAAFIRPAGIAPNTYNQWEHGKQRPQLDLAMQLCETYGLTLDWIYRGDPAGLPYDLAQRILGKDAA